MNFCGKFISAPLVWFEGKFQPDIHIQIDHDGIITAIGPNLASNKAGLHLIKDVAVLPGFVNAHSHSFHRYLRGRSQIGSDGADSFWKWRNNMYALLDDLTYSTFKQFCKETFQEMLAAGITTVGEFHYVHHSLQRFDLDMAVVEAAQEIGIHLVLIETLYSRSGFFSSELTQQQKAFGSELEEFLKHVEFLGEKLSATVGVFLAVAAHSLRAVPISAVQQLWKWANRHQRAFHLHLEEQPQEVEDCIAVEGKSPCQLLLDNLQEVVHPLTAVHCTYTPRPHLDALASRGGHLCVCPTTEGFLGDGIPDLSDKDKLCLGTDCNNRICFLEEMRWLCFCQNMKKNSRNCAQLDAPKLVAIATVNGASALQLANCVGTFQVGHYLDLVAFDMQSPRLKQFVGGDSQQLVDAIVFAGGNSEIVMTAVAGIVKFQK